MDEQDQWQAGYEAGLEAAKKAQQEARSLRNKERAEHRRAMVKATGQRQTWGRGKMPTLEDVQQVKTMRADGLTLRGIRDATGLSLGTVHRILMSVYEAEKRSVEDVVVCSDCGKKFTVVELEARLKPNAGCPSCNEVELSDCQDVM